MAIINFYTKEDESEQYSLNKVNFKGNALTWILQNIENGVNFQVYEGDINKGNEISRDAQKIFKAPEVSVFLLPSGDSFVKDLFIFGGAFGTTKLLEALTPPDLPDFNRQQQSPNNSLADRRNRARPNERIVDVCGKIKSIPDVLSREYERYTDNIQERIGYYCVGRHNLLIEELKEGDTLISDIETSSAGVYGAYKSPNNSTPGIQIGTPINEEVYSVVQSPDATGQTLKAGNDTKMIIRLPCKVSNQGFLFSEPLPEGQQAPQNNFSAFFKVGDNVDLTGITIEEGGQTYTIGANTSLVTAVTAHNITFDITGDSSWANATIGSDMTSTGATIQKDSETLVGDYKITSIKIDRLLVNVNALSGMYKEDENGKQEASVDFNVKYQKLDDDFNPIGSVTTVVGNITGEDADEKGTTVDIDLGAPTYIEWSVQRTTPKDLDFDGNVSDEIKLKSVFGLASIDLSDFGNVTTIQTKRTSAFLTSATKNPELNCLATELVQKYTGSGNFETAFTPNTQAMQTLIRVALDPYMGRRSQAELDLDLILQTQSDCEAYFNNVKAGSFNYSFDSTKISAQETFTSIAKSVFCTIWREGRLLKVGLEKPQTIPSMMFTHRSKQPNSETWNRVRDTEDKKDSIEFIYTDDKLYTKETLYYPTDRSGTNPLRVEMVGIKGIELATWHMMRSYNKMTYQEVSVDFSATAEGKFIKPNNLISVVKGSRIHTFDGYCVALNGLELTLSQEVEFTPNDTHSIIFKRRDGSTESVLCAESTAKNVITLLQIPSETIYTGNDELKTEFSFGNEARLSGQLMIADEIAPNEDYVSIKAVNYSDLYYKDDPIQPVGSAFNSGFNDGFS